MERPSPFTLVAAAAITDGQRVYIDSNGKAAVSGVGASDRTDGIAVNDAASGDYVAIRDRKTPGLFEVVAAGAISAGAAFYGAASGKVSTTSSGNILGYAQEAATADGDKILAFLV